VSAVIDALIYGDTQTSSALRHEVPVSIGDPFLYMESDGRRAVLTNALEDSRIAEAAPDVERLLADEFGRDELIESGRSPAEIDLELCARAVAAIGIKKAAMPPDFPIALGDRLRAAGLKLTPDDELFVERRRRKSDAEMAGIRRASGVATSAMGEAARMLREAAIDGDSLVLDGSAVTSELVRDRIRAVCARAGAPAPADIMIKPMGPDPEGGHEPGSGPLPAHLPIEIDLWPQDERSGCWSDMTRTFVRGEISDPIGALHELVLDAFERSCAAVAPGMPCVELYGIACAVFEAAGHPTGRTKQPGETLRDGFYFALGHGVGLEIHEAPLLGRSGRGSLIDGDVIAVEPGTSVTAIGGCRVEDLLLVTPEGCERLTGAFPYDLVP
jgi:Xaa-Pro aminopeptidase